MFLFSVDIDLSIQKRTAAKRRSQPSSYLETAARITRSAPAKIAGAEISDPGRVSAARRSAAIGPGARADPPPPKAAVIGPAGGCHCTRSTRRHIAIRPVGAGGLRMYLAESRQAHRADTAALFGFSARLPPRGFKLEPPCRTLSCKARRRHFIESSRRAMRAPGNWALAIRGTSNGVEWWRRCQRRDEDALQLAELSVGLRHGLCAHLRHAGSRQIPDLPRPVGRHSRTPRRQAFHQQLPLFRRQRAATAVPAALSAGRLQWESPATASAPRSRHFM